MSREQAELFDPMTADPIELINHLGDTDPDELRWPKRLHDLFELHRAYNLRLGMDPEDAALDARDRCILLGDYLGARPYNIPRGDALRIALRDKLIWAQFTGRNHEALAARYGLDLVHLYRILRQQRRLSRGKLQGKLFEPPR